MASTFGPSSSMLKPKSVEQVLSGSGLKIHFHPHSSEPVKALLKFSRSENTLVIRYKTSFFSTSHTNISLSFDTLCHLIEGRQTTNFLRTLKYIHPDQIPDSDERCFSLKFNNSCTYDLEFQSKKTCNEVFTFFSQQKTDAKVVSSTIRFKSPTGISMTCFHVVNHPAFSNFILMCIVLNIISMSLQSPIETNKTYIQHLRNIDLSMLLVFSFELALKLIAFEGLLPYLRDPWNVTDFILILVSWVSELPVGGSGVNMSAFRGFRALKALKHCSGILSILNTFTATMSMILNALFCYLYLLFLFSVIGLHLFRDSLLNQCVVHSHLLSNSSGDTFHPTVPQKFCSPEAANSCGINQFCMHRNTNESDNEYIGFHSFQISLFTAFKVTSRAGVGTAMDATMQAKSPFAAIYFIFLILLVSFMILALFVAIVRGSFSRVESKTKQEAKVLNQKKEQYIKKNRQNIGRTRKSKSQSLPNLKKLQKFCSVVPLDPKNVNPSKVPEKNSKIKEVVSRLIASSSFENIINFCILANTIFLAMEYHGMSVWYKDMLSLAEIIFTFIFTSEMLLKIFGLGGIKKYLLYDSIAWWNRFDFLIVVGAGVDFLFQIISDHTKIDFHGDHFHELNNRCQNDYEHMSYSGASGGGFSLLRAIRLLRIIRILRNSSELLKVVEAIINSLPALLNLFAFMLIINLVFAILGMQLYGGLFPSNSRSNFDTILNSLMTLFKMFAGGGTFKIFDDALSSKSGATAPLFFISVNIFSVYITLNFMVVILLANFGLSPEEITNLREKRKLNRLSSLVDRNRTEGFNKIARGIINSERGSSRRSSLANLSIIVEKKVHSRRDYSLYIFSPTNKIRLMSKAVLISTKEFIMFSILVSSLCLTLESPIYDKKILDLIDLADYVFVIIYFLEFLLKVISTGFVIHGQDKDEVPYLVNNWNRLDFCILCFSGLDLLFDNGGIGKLFRIGRILRPVRVIGRRSGVRTIMLALIKSLGEVMYSIILISCLFFIFGVMGVSFFSGRFAYCNDPSVPCKFECIGWFLDKYNVAQPRIWKNPMYHFDNIGASCNTLFGVVTGKGWLPVLYSAMDITAVDDQPRQNESSYNSVFFVLFIFVGRFYLLKVFVGIIVGNFRRYSGTALLTQPQLIWLHTKQKLSTVCLKIQIPNDQALISNYRNPIYQLVNHYYFEFGTYAILVIHTALLAFYVLKSEIVMFHWFFTTIYCAEIVLKVLSTNVLYHFRYSYTQLWNVIEVVVVFSMIFFPILHELTLWKFFTFGYWICIIRAFQFSKLAKLLKNRFAGIQLVYDTLVSSVSAMGNVTLLLILVLFFYATLGMHLFGTTKWNYGINGFTNYSTFPMALLTMFKVAAGDNWLDILYASLIDIPHCSTSGLNKNSDCGSTGIGSRLYFYSFFILIFLVILNFYVAAILDSYTFVLSAESTSKSIISSDALFKMDDVLKLRDEWVEFDPIATGRICYKSYYTLMKRLQLSRNSLTKFHGQVDMSLIKYQCMFLMYKRNRNSWLRSFTSMANMRDSYIYFQDLVEVLVRQKIPPDYLLVEDEFIRCQLQEIVDTNKSALIIQRNVRKETSEGSKG